MLTGVLTSCQHLWLRQYVWPLFAPLHADPASWTQPAYSYHPSFGGLHHNHPYRVRIAENTTGLQHTTPRSSLQSKSEHSHSEIALSAAMTTRYRVEYALKTHRRDQLIEWIKGLLAVPFVLNCQPAAAYDEGPDANLDQMARTAHQRYADIFRDVEALISDHIQHQGRSNARSKLSMLVPTISAFFTPLALEEAFVYQDTIRAISSRRFVAPSFNDIRLILNTAQLMSIVKPKLSTSQQTPSSTLELLTFDGDVTLYEDGGSLHSPEADPMISRLLYFLSNGVRIGIVTAAGYVQPANYYNRLSGLLNAVKQSTTLTTAQKSNLIIMGGESNFLLVFDASSEYCLKYIHRRDWILEAMRGWNEEAIQSLIDVAETAFRSCIQTLHLKAKVLRKERAVGIYAADQSQKLTREQLEETVLVVQQVVETSLSTTPPPIHAEIPYTVFNGGADVFLDIGDKSLGVQACQKWFGGILPGRTLHVGDQFLSGGGNDFKARSACCCAWIASPLETESLLDEIITLMK